MARSSTAAVRACNEVRITMVRMVGTLATGRALTRCARLRRGYGCLAAGMRWPTGVPTRIAWRHDPRALSGPAHRQRGYIAYAQVAPHDHPGVGAVRHGARLERHERGDLADRRGPEHDAFETGKRLLPLSVAMLVFALLGPRIAGRRSPRTVAQAGLVAVSIGAIVMLATLDVELEQTPGFKIALALIGAGAGLLASQLGNVIMSSVAPAKTSEGGGLQGTAQNLGSSLGTAIIGAVLLASLATGFSTRIADNPAIPAAAREQIVAGAEQGIDIVPVEDAEKAAVRPG